MPCGCLLKDTERSDGSYLKYAVDVTLESGKSRQIGVNYLKIMSFSIGGNVKEPEVPSNTIWDVPTLEKSKVIGAPQTEAAKSTVSARKGSGAGVFIANQLLSGIR